MPKAERSFLLWRTKAVRVFCCFLPRLSRPPPTGQLASSNTGRSIMRLHGRHISRLIENRLPHVTERVSFLSYPCHIHRTLCHHAPRPSLRRVGAPAPLHFGVRRGAKTKSSSKLKDLPQGALKLEPYNEGADDSPRYPTVVQQHRNNMQKFKNCILLTRVGGFYEVWSLVYPRLPVKC